MEKKGIINNSSTDPNKILPMKYPWAREHYKAGVANNWTPDEVSMQLDIELWKKQGAGGLSDEERRMILWNLGFFSKRQNGPGFGKAVASLKKGEISGPVKTQYGYHIIKMTDMKEGPVIEFDKVKDIIMQKLSGDKQKEAFEKYMAELKKAHKVEINKDALSKNAPQTAPQSAPQFPVEQPAPSTEAPKK